MATVWLWHATAEGEDESVPVFLLIRATWPFGLAELYPASAASIAAAKAARPSTFPYLHAGSLLDQCDLSGVDLSRLLAP